MFSSTKVIKILKKSSIHYFIALYSMYPLSWYVASLNKSRCEYAAMHDGEKYLIKFTTVYVGKPIEWILLVQISKNYSKLASADEWLHVMVNILSVIDYRLFKWCILFENN